MSETTVLDPVDEIHDQTEQLAQDDMPGSSWRDDAPVNQIPETKEPDQDQDAEHVLAKISELESACEKAESEFLAANEEAKWKKKAFEARVSELRKAIRQATEPLPLYDQNGQPSANGVAKPADDESWRSVEVTDLVLPRSVYSHLYAAELRTIGQIADWTKDKRLIDIPGIGQATGEKIEAALDQFWQKREADWMDNMVEKQRGGNGN